MNALPSVLAAALRAGLFPALLTSGLCAQIPIGGALTGTLTAGVYHATGSLSVPVGQTLTLNPGVIVKFANSSQELLVDGTLRVNGTAGNPVVFTGLQDDSAGGDTNGNGPSSASPTAWRGVLFGATASASVLTYADIRYGGAGFISNAHLSNSNPTFVNCTFRHNYTHGVQLSGNSFPTVTNCTFTGNGGNAIEGVPVQALAGFQNNTASGNAGNIARITVGTVGANLTVTPAAMLGGAITADTTLTVPAGVTLTFAAGVVCKLMNNSVELALDGTLRVNGTAGSPVVFTGFADDSAGGDTNNNGASNAAPTSWRGIVFHSTAGASASTLDYADIRYGGAGFIANVHLVGANPTLRHCTIRNNYTHGMQLNGNSFPTVTNCTFTGNGGNAMEAVPVGALANCLNNTATGNAGNIARVTVGTVAGNLTIPAAAMLGGAIAVDTSLVVNAGATLGFGPGVVCKLMGSASEITVSGTLRVNGTAASPVVFTGFADDSAGGDTNNNGPSSASPTSWRGIVFASTASGSVLDYADIRYGGAGFIANVSLNAASPTFRHCTIRNNYTHGMQLNGNSTPTVSDCTFTGNGAVAVEGVPIAAVPGFTNNSASGNAGNYLRVTTADVGAVLQIGPQSILEGALVLATDLHVLPTGWLVVEQGVVCKFSGQHEVVVDGTLFLRGTSYEPIVFTAFADDSIAGDTNNNGPSSGSPTSWRGITWNNSAAPGRAENVVIRYTGAGFLPALTANNPHLDLRAVRVDHAYDRGFVLQALGSDPVNLVAFACGGFGVQLSGGSFQLVHATCAGNGTGMRREAGWSGYVVNSISHGNGTNFANFGAGGQVVRCNGGFAGTNGNVNVDPRFVNQAGGDLHLQASSPCLGVADLVPALIVQKDFDENSRILDHALTGIPAPDLGAFELPAWNMNVSGVARPGSTLTFTLSGPPGDSFLALGLLDGATPFFPWGMLLAGANPGSSVALLYPVPLPVGFPIPLPLVNDPALLAISAGIQTLTLPSGSLSLGNFTRLYRFLVRP